MVISVLNGWVVNSTWCHIEFYKKDCRVVVRANQDDYGFCICVYMNRTNYAEDEEFLTLNDALNFVNTEKD